MTIGVTTPDDDGSTLDESFLQWYRSLPRSCFEVPSFDDLATDETVSVERPQPNREESA